MNISEEAIQLLAAYKHEIAQWRMQKPRTTGGLWIAHDSWRDTPSVQLSDRAYVSEQFNTEAECITWVQLRALTVALQTIRANAA